MPVSAQDDFSPSSVIIRLCCRSPTHVVNEALDLGLHAPVSELHLAELVGTHDGRLAGTLADLFDPVVRQRPPFGLG